MSYEDVAAFHREARREVRSKRREAVQSEGVLASSIMAAADIWDAQKAEGVSFQARVASMERTVRACWPFTRDWTFLCANCDDVGLVALECLGDAQCGRTGPHLPHSYGQPCWCQLGRRFKEKSRPAPEDVVTSAAKVTKPTKWGGR